MRAIIAECRAQHNNRRGILSAASIGDICGRIGLAFLTRPLIDLTRISAADSPSMRALEQLRSFGADSGEYYFAERLRPSIAGTVVARDARSRWVHALLQQGSEAIEAYDLVVDRWIVEPWERPIDRHCVEAEYRTWLSRCRQ